MPTFLLRAGVVVLTALLLSLGGSGSAQAQLRESARPAQIESSQSHSQLNPYRPLESYVQRTDALTVRPGLLPPLSPDSPRLSQGEKLIWGSAGLLINGLCSSRQDPYDTSPENCDRVGDRGMRALLEGLFSPK